MHFALARLGRMQVVELLLARVLHLLLDLDLDVNILDHLHPDSLLERLPPIVLPLSLEVKSLPRELQPRLERDLVIHLCQEWVEAARFLNKFVVDVL